MRFSKWVQAIGANSAAARGLGLAAAASVALAGCAQQQVRTSSYHGHEHFAEGKYGVASPRIVNDGEAVPRGGGQYLVGHPYTIAGHTYYPGENQNYSAVGMASWYGDAFHGRRTANGEVYDMRALSAAHPTMPLPSYARVTNLANGHSVIVRVNDRGPYHGGRVMDVSSRVADVLDFKGAGTARVKVDYVGRAPMEGSDDQQLLATLRTDGTPATIDGIPAPNSVMLADNTPSKPSPLLSLFRPAPHAAPPPPAPAPAPIAEPDVEVASAAPVPQRILNPPTPPSRPFDLGYIPSASMPGPASPPKPPIRLSQNDRALYFVSDTSRDSDPLAKLLKRKLAKPERADDDE